MSQTNGQPSHKTQAMNALNTALGLAKSPPSDLNSRLLIETIGEVHAQVAAIQEVKRPRPASAKKPARKPAEVPAP